jgi:hypothetical protein
LQKTGFFILTARSSSSSTAHIPQSATRS